MDTRAPDLHKSWNLRLAIETELERTREADERTLTRQIAFFLLNEFPYEMILARYKLMDCTVEDEMAFLEHKECGVRIDQVFR